MRGNGGPGRRFRARGVDLNRCSRPTLFAAVSALLTALVAVRAPVLGPAGLGAAYDLDPAARVALAPDLAAAMQLTLVLPAALTALSLAVAVTAMRAAPLTAARVR